MAGIIENLEESADQDLHAKRDGLDANGSCVNSGIVVLSGPGPLPAIIINAVIEHFGPVTVIQEDKEPTRILLRRRLKLLGFLATVGQVAFGMLLNFIHLISRKRIDEIILDADLKHTFDVNNGLIHVQSVNDETCREAIKKASPNVVLVVGTRMIRQPTLACVEAPFINYHAGVNPLYRGMNGGYWALSRKDAENAGVSVHLVDEGVDTGDVLYLARFKAQKRDNFVTYPFLQAAIGAPLVIRALQDAITGQIKPIKVALPSKQWFHPTLWHYLWCGVMRGAW